MVLFVPQTSPVPLSCSREGAMVFFHYCIISSIKGPESFLLMGYFRTFEHLHKRVIITLFSLSQIQISSFIHLNILKAPIGPPCYFKNTTPGTSPPKLRLSLQPLSDKQISLSLLAPSEIARSQFGRQPPSAKSIRIASCLLSQSKFSSFFFFSFFFSLPPPPPFHLFLLHQPLLGCLLQLFK